MKAAKTRSEPDLSPLAGIAKGGLWPIRDPAPPPGAWAHRAPRLRRALRQAERALGVARVLPGGTEAVLIAAGGKCGPGRGHLRVGSLLVLVTLPLSPGQTQAGLGQLRGDAAALAPVQLFAATPT